MSIPAIEAVPWWSDAAEAYERIMPSELKLVQNAMVCGLLFGLASSMEAKRIFEIGVQFGVSTRMLCLAAAHNGGRLWSCDIDPVCGAGQLREDLAQRGLLPYWRFYGRPSQEVEPITETDMLYIDGDHRYEAVASDMARHGKAVRDGGVIVLDDYVIEGKKVWLNEHWDVADPLLIGPHALIRMTPQLRAAL